VRRQGEVATNATVELALPLRCAASLRLAERRFTISGGLWPHEVEDPSRI